MIVCCFVQAKSLAIELFRWFGVAIKPTLEKHLKPVQVCIHHPVRVSTQTD